MGRGGGGEDGVAVTVHLSNSGGSFSAAGGGQEKCNQAPEHPHPQRLAGPTPPANSFFFRVEVPLPAALSSRCFLCALCLLAGWLGWGEEPVRAFCEPMAAGVGEAGAPVSGENRSRAAAASQHLPLPRESVNSAGPKAASSAEQGGDFCWVRPKGVISQV